MMVRGVARQRGGAGSREAEGREGGGCVVVTCDWKRDASTPLSENCMSTWRSALRGSLFLLSQPATEYVTAPAKCAIAKPSDLDLPLTRESADTLSAVLPCGRRGVATMEAGEGGGGGAPLCAGAHRPRGCQGSAAEVGGEGR